MDKLTPDCVSLGCKMPVAFRDARTGFSFCVVHKRLHEAEHPGREWSQIKDCDPNTGDEVCMRCGKQVKETEAYAVHPGYICRNCAVPKDIADTIRTKYAILKAAKELKAHAQDAADKAVDELECVTEISDKALSEFRSLVAPHAGVYSLGPGCVLIIEHDFMGAVTGGCRWRESEVL